MFELIIKYLGFLKHVPLLPRLFDAMMRISLFFSNTNALDHIDEIENEVLSWEKTSIHTHKFGGTQFDMNDREIGHIHSNGLLDILFNKEIKTALLKEGRAKDHHTFKNSGWISFLIRNEEDKKYAIRLLRESYLLKLQR
jgi:hypothetical protein